MSKQHLDAPATPIRKPRCIPLDHPIFNRFAVRTDHVSSDVHSIDLSITATKPFAMLFKASFTSSALEQKLVMDSPFHYHQKGASDEFLSRGSEMAPFFLECLSGLDPEDLKGIWEKRSFVDLYG